ncbi:MAG: transposase family protein [Kiritimatiellia bacterium]
MSATLEYLREYRTYAHIKASFGMAESNVYRGAEGGRTPWSGMGRLPCRGGGPR